MLYAITNQLWGRGRPLMPAAARGGLFRSRAEARAGAIDGTLVALAVRYDATRGVLTPLGPVASAAAGDWRAPAIVDARGGLTFFGAIPAALVRPVPAAELRADAGRPRPFPRPHRVRRAAAPASIAGAPTALGLRVEAPGPPRPLGLARAFRTWRPTSSPPQAPRRSIAGSAGGADRGGPPGRGGNS